MLTVFLIFIVLLVCLITYIVNSSVVQSVHRLHNVEELFEEVSSINDVSYQSQVAKTSGWATSKSFEVTGSFLLHTSNSGVPLKCSAWWSDEHQVYLLFYLAEERDRMSVMHDMVTRFNDEKSLTTCTHIDGLFFPKPNGDRVQIFKGGGLSELLKVHLKSVQNISREEGLTVAEDKKDLFTLMRDAIKGQAELIMSLPFWKLRGTYWYFVKKHFLATIRY